GGAAGLDQKSLAMSSGHDEPADERAHPHGHRARPDGKDDGADAGKAAARIGQGGSQAGSAATTSISIRRSGCERRLTSTVVLVGSVTPRISSRKSAFFT